MNPYWRAKKLMNKAKTFVVVAVDEPYFKQVYDLVREREKQIGRWTAEDEKLYLAAIEEWQKATSQKNGRS